MYHVQELQKMHRTIFVQHLREKMLAIDCNSVKSSNTMLKIDNGSMKEYK
jgi:hypothetical protein